MRAINLLAGRLYGVHLKDFSEPKKDAKGVVLGRGQLDLAATFRALAKANLPDDACLALEYEEHPENPIDDIRACLSAAANGAEGQWLDQSTVPLRHRSLSFGAV